MAREVTSVAGVKYFVVDRKLVSSPYPETDLERIERQQLGLPPRVVSYVSTRVEPIDGLSRLKIGGE